MFNNRYVVQKSPGVGGKPIPEHEPCLVVRAQDVLAVPLLVHYIGEYGKLLDPSSEVLRDLAKHMVAIIEWQGRNRSAVKIADR